MIWLVFLPLTAGWSWLTWRSRRDDWGEVLDPTVKLREALVRFVVNMRPFMESMRRMEEAMRAFGLALGNAVRALEYARSLRDGTGDERAARPGSP